MLSKKLERGFCVNQQLQGAQKYFSVKKSTAIIYDAAFMIARYSKSLSSLDPNFRTKIMLAVTDVNGCRICNAYHSKELKKGHTENSKKPDIKFDTNTFLKPKEDRDTLALSFATHYALMEGRYDCSLFHKLIDYYGNKEAYGIMASIKMITFGNVNGIALGNIANRLRFRKVENANVLTDLYNGLIAYVLLPMFIIVNLFRRRKSFEC